MASDKKIGKESIGMTKHLETKVERSPGQPVEQTFAPSFTSIYSNSVSVIVTPWDIRFIFGEVGPNQVGEVRNEQKVSVVMSHPHAKAMLQILGENIKSIETKMGPIAIPSLA